MNKDSVGVKRHLTAFMNDADRDDLSNVIHSADGAREYGYAAPLVAGVTTYGWTVPVIREVVGDTWLDDGWIDISFRRPIYPNDELSVCLTALPTENQYELIVTKADDSRALVGYVGLGRADWFSEIEHPISAKPVPQVVARPRLTTENLPMGQDLLSMVVSISSGDATEYAALAQADLGPPWCGASARLHPGWLAGRAGRLIEHSYQHFPAIHTRSLIQHCSPGFADQTLTVSGRIVNGYVRKGHAYLELDCWVAGEDMLIILVQRHTTIYQLAKR